MNIGGAIFFTGISAIGFWLSSLMKEDKKNDYSLYKKTKATITNTRQAINTSDHHHDGSYNGYYYIVDFIDEKGNKAVGISEKFINKRTLENGEETEIFYWKDKKEEYKIHFCNEKVYENEIKAKNKSSKYCFLFGIAMLIIAVIMLFK